MQKHNIYIEHMATFSLTIECNFAEFWRYNLIVTGAKFLNHERVDMIKHIDNVAPVGSNLAETPAGYARAPKTELTLDGCDALTLYIYVLPHTMPRTRLTDEARPFELHITISRDGETLYNRRHSIAQWVGDNIEIKCPAESM